MTDNELDLAIPEKSRTAPPDYLSDIAKNRAWVNNLPLGSIGDSSRILFNALRTLNTAEIPFNVRIVITEQILPAIQLIQRNLEKKYIDSALPLNDKLVKIAKLNKQLCSLMANSYKCCVVDAARDDNAKKTESNQLIVAIHRSISYLSEIMVQTSMVYEGFPSRNWRELHQLFALAERLGLERTPVTDSNSDNRELTILDQYKRILLFAISSPYRMRQREIRAVYRKLNDWIEHVRLRKKTDEKYDTKSAFVVSLWSDEMPIHGTIGEVEQNPHLRLISTKRLISKLRDELEAGSDEEGALSRVSGADGIPRYLLRQLIKAWGVPAKREFTRTRLNFELSVAIGLNSIHALINRPPVKAASANDISFDPDSLDWLNRDPTITHALESTVYQDTPSNKFALEPETRIKTDDQMPLQRHGTNNGKQEEVPGWVTGPDTSDSKVYPCETINESAGGYCLSWPDDSPPLKVGELVGVQSTANSTQFGIGAIRWLRYDLITGLQVGLQLLSPASIAATGALDGVASLDQQSCLILPKSTTTGEMDSIITPPLPFKLKSRLVLESDNGKKHVELTRLIESNAAFCQFEYEDMDKQQTTKQESDTDGGFDNIWSYL